MDSFELRENTCSAPPEPQSSISPCFHVATPAALTRDPRALGLRSSCSEPAALLRASTSLYVHRASVPPYFDVATHIAPLELYIFSLPAAPPGASELDTSTLIRLQGVSTYPEVRTPWLYACTSPLLTTRLLEPQPPYLHYLHAFDASPELPSLHTSTPLHLHAYGRI